MIVVKDFLLALLVLSIPLSSMLAQANESIQGEFVEGDGQETIVNNLRDERVNIYGTKSIWL